jgi:glc operon protein GlcG
MMAHLLALKQLTLAGAKVIGAAAEAEAVKNGWCISVAVVDAGGHPLYLARMDGALLASYRGALMKASTALQFGRPTKRLEEDVARGRIHVLAFDGALPVDGGIPIEIEGQTIGGIGVGGTKSGREATQCAEAGLAVLDK